MVQFGDFAYLMTAAAGMGRRQLDINDK